VAAFDVEAALEGLKALVDTIPSMEAVQIGAPEVGQERIGAWVSVGDPGEIRAVMAGSVYELDLNLIVWFRYTVEGSEQAAEAQLADFITELVRRLIRNRQGAVDGVTMNLNGSVSRMGLPQAATGSSEYAMMAGQENRVYPLGVRVIQQETE
jgi:hypothetical protein